MNKRCLRNLTVLLVTILFAGMARGQQFSWSTKNWRFSNPQQFGITALDVDFFDNNNVIAVGGDGGIMRSTDGGSNWTYGAFTYVTGAGAWSKPSFSDVHYVSANVAYAVGTNGCMAKTVDGGVNWTFVRTPLYASVRNINAVWFINDNTGYIGGAWNTPDSIPKLYYTNNGGATWDSLNAPAPNGKTRVGYINNPNLPPLIWDVTAKAKEIYRIEFTSPTQGYICGSSSADFPRIPSSNASPNCTPTGNTTSTGSHAASLLWKYSNGTLTDYSLSKERLGYSGINTNTITCTTLYGNITPMTQTYRAMNIVNDSMVVLMSFNNNIVVRVYTGTNDNTVNLATGLTEKGRYQLTSFPFPPTQGPQAGSPIPNPNNNLFSNPYNLRRAANGKLYTGCNFGLMWTSVDTGRTWVSERSLPPGQPWSSLATWALDIAPNGKVLTMGQNGVVADSTAAWGWRSNYKLPAVGSYNKINFADCNNGIAAGGGNIARTTNGGKSWDEIIRQDFVNLNISIQSFAYINNSPDKAYFVTNAGGVYRSDNIRAANPTLDPVFSSGVNQMWDVATAGPDTVWVCGYSNPPFNASSNSKVWRSVNSGLTWTTYNFPAGSTFSNLRFIEFPSRNIGYAAGTRDTIYKTTDGGASWVKLPLPGFGITPQITYTDLFALNDNTIFVTGNGFPRKVVYVSSDGGNSWRDITSNILSFGGGNLNGVVFHDLSNGYVISPGGVLFKTTDGGANWAMDIAPTSNLFTTLSFAPQKVPAGTPFANRRLFVTGANLPNVAGPIMEYGDTTNLNVSGSAITTSSCVNAAQGTISVTANGGIAPYTYSLDGGALQTSGVFNNVTPGAHTITIRDAACGINSSSVTVPSRPVPVVNAGPDKTIVEGYNTLLNGIVLQGNMASVAWTPNATLTDANTLTPYAKPAATTTYTMTVTDANGCVSTDNAVVTVLPYCLKIMDAFTPNGDNINDRWIVTNNGGQCVDLVKVVVFNRYGGIVYKNDNYTNNWDGTYEGKPVADGTYYYAITYRLINGVSIVLKGDVTILR